MRLSDVGLKPCPFCGSDTPISIEKNFRRGFEVSFLRVECICGANIEIEGDNLPYEAPTGWQYQLGESASSKWNRRKGEINED